MTAPSLMQRSTDAPHAVPANLAGAVSFAAAVLLLPVDIRLSAIPLCLFVLACLAAPFCPTIGFFLPIISRGTAQKNGVALTFDDGPDPLTTPSLLRLLSEYNARATFFVTGKKAALYPDLIKAMVASGHAIGNHTFNHDTLIMLKGRRALDKEIGDTQRLLKTLGIATHLFRPPAGITNPILGDILTAYKLVCINFSCRAFDAGNRRIRHLSKKIAASVRSGEIILLHDTAPAGKPDEMVPRWLNEVEQIINELVNKGLSILPLSEIIDMPVMTLDDNTTPHA